MNISSNSQKLFNDRSSTGVNRSFIFRCEIIELLLAGHKSMGSFSKSLSNNNERDQLVDVLIRASNGDVSIKINLYARNVSIRAN